MSWRWKCYSNKAINRRDLKLRTICERHQNTTPVVSLRIFFQHFVTLPLLRLLTLIPFVCTNISFFSVPLELCVCTCLFFHSPILHSACTIYYRDSRMKFSPAVSHIQLLFCLNVVRLMQIFLWATFNYSHSMNCEKSVWNWIRYFLTFPPKKIQWI